MNADKYVAGLPFGWGAIFALVNLLLGGGAFAAWIRKRPEMRKADADADLQLRSEMWKDIEALKLAKDAQSRRLSTAEARIAGQTVQIGQQRFVLTLVIDELERIQPDNVVARQARILLREIQPNMAPHDGEIAAMSETLARAGCD